MNLTKLFELQRRLDERIIEEKGLHNLNLLDIRKLALLVELGELANEWRGFKFWSRDLQPRREKMLEEYVDCLHFFLSIGLELGVDPKMAEWRHMVRKKPVVTCQFQKIFYWVSSMDGVLDWLQAFWLFIGLGEMLGFSWDEIEEAYRKKNQVNFERQDQGY